MATRPSSSTAPDSQTPAPPAAARAGATLQPCGEALPRATVISRDGSLWVMYKPAGLACHPGAPGVPDLITVARQQLGAPEGLSPIHRLDRETSGLVLMSDDAELRAQLGRAFAAGEVRKRYLALVIGATNRKGIIRFPLQDQRRGRPLPATTRYRALMRLGGFTLLRVRPQSGRKHQIRKHLQALGRPIVGDARYPGRRPVRIPAFPGRLWLHAETVELPDGRVFEAPLSVELVTHLQALGAQWGQDSPTAPGRRPAGDGGIGEAR